MRMRITSLALAATSATKPPLGSMRATVVVLRVTLSMNTRSVGEAVPCVAVTVENPLSFGTEAVIDPAGGVGGGVVSRLSKPTTTSAGR